eukprot:gene43769-53526_t
MRILVTGGSGYIGSHTVGALLARGDTVIVVDDLVTGHASRISEVPIVHADLASEASVPVLAQAFIDNQIDAVIHFAARKQVGESVERPAWYYQQNVGGLANLLIAMENAGVKKLVFSSSAAVYGQADGAISEAHPTVPINPYGQTKLVGEQLITASTAAWGLSAASLRYFNVAGAGNAELADTQALNLVPIVFEAIDAGRPPVIFGGDYDTVDGTCVRDYVHVVDVAEAHLATLDWLDGTASNHALNIGTGVGTSVRQMINEIATVSGIDFHPELLPRRAGDPAAVVATVDRIRSTTGWQARVARQLIFAAAAADAAVECVPPAEFPRGLDRAHDKSKPAELDQQRTLRQSAYREGHHNQRWPRKNDAAAPRSEKPGADKGEPQKTQKNSEPDQTQLEPDIQKTIRRGQWRAPD